MNGNEESTLLTVQGMTCDACARHVDEALKELKGVRAVEVNVDERTVRVRHSERTELAAMLAALEEAGYPSQPEDSQGAS